MHLGAKGVYGRSLRIDMNFGEHYADDDVVAVPNENVMREWKVCCSGKNCFLLGAGGFYEYQTRTVGAVHDCSMGREKERLEFCRTKNPHC